MAFHCDVCNIPLNCVQQFTQHTEGKAHKKRLAGSGGRVSKPKIDFVPEGQLQSVNPNKVEDQSYQSGSHKFNTQPQTPSEDWAQVKFCHLCDKVLNSSHQAQQHFTSVKHLKRSVQSNNESQESGARGTKRKIVKNEYEDDIRQNGPGDGLGFDIDPELDQVSVESYTSLTGEGQEKKSKMDNAFCYLCNKILTSPHVANVHYNSIKHLKRSQSQGNHNPTIVSETKAANKTIPEPPATPLPDDPEPPATPLPDNQEPVKDTFDNNTPNTYKEFLDQKAALNNQSATAGHFFCTFCNLGLYSQTQIDAHRSGARHKKNVTKAKGQQTAITSTTSS